MLPPFSMVTKKNRAKKMRWLTVALAMFLAGCMPPGPRALLDGKKLLERGEYTMAVEKLRTATTLLNTNAQAWNYLGVACQQAGQPADSEKAFLRALALNHDFPEAHYNLGCLYLAENRLDAARLQFTAFTLRRGNVPEGFNKLGMTQMRLREYSTAEKSFTDAIRISPQNAEALNNLGVVKLLRGRLPEAVSCFNQALKEQTNYAPAVLNLAIVAHQYTRDRAAAVQKYQEYLALRPPAETAEAARAALRQLQLEMAPPGTHLPPPAQPLPAPATNRIPPSAAPPVRSTSGNPRAELSTGTNFAKPALPNPQLNSASGSSQDAVRVPSEPVFKPAQDTSGSLAQNSSTTTAPQNSVGKTNHAQKRNLLQKINPANLFHSDERSTPRTTPAKLTETPAVETVDASSSNSAAPTFPRYKYKSPPKPASGNRADAERACMQGFNAQQAHKLPEAIAAYRSAVQLDPSYYEGHFNLAIANVEAGNLQPALSAYEMALAARPDGLDARLNFALVLSQANYMTDAVNELEKLLGTYPNEARAHLALGYFYANQLRQPAKARPHYQRVIDLDPQNPKADSIRYWLSANQ